MGSRVLTRQQVLEWRENWSSSDRALINSALDALPDRDYYQPPSGQYVAARANGRVVLQISPGVMYWTSPQWAQDVDPALVPEGLGGDRSNTGRWYHLSTYHPGPGRDQGGLEVFTAACPVCFLKPSLSGACGCD